MKDGLKNGLDKRRMLDTQEAASFSEDELEDPAPSSQDMVSTGQVT